MKSTLYNNQEAITASSVKEWRQWLQKNHLIKKAVWLIIYKMDSGVSSVYYPEAVDEALCFGWVDSKVNKRDDKSYYQYFARRNPKSNWSKINKEKVKRLIREKRMAPAGLEMIKLAKATGTWNALDGVENGILPDDLIKALAAKPIAKKNWEAFPKSTQRGILEWILNAKRPETRASRIQDTVEKAAQNIRANQYRQ